MKWLCVASVTATVLLGVSLTRDLNGQEALTPARAEVRAAGIAGAVGTSGIHAGAAENVGASVITEIETITGINDAMALVGRRVDLHVDVQRRSSDRAFWVGSPDNRVLVVLSSDERRRDRHAHGGAPHHRVVPVRRGQRATVAGMIRRIPAEAQRAEWRLSAADERELLERKVYIRADTVGSEGHGVD